MTRRDLLALAATGTAAIAFPNLARAKSPTTMPTRPEPLKPGDKVAIVAPAGPVETPEDLEGFLQRVRDLGLEPIQAPNLTQKYGFFGGTDQERADDLNWAFSNREIKAIFPVRGGYGITRLLHLLAYKMIAQNPKIICGYSDITGLLIAINQECDFVTYHGPVLASSKSEFSDQYFHHALFAKSQSLDLLNPTPPILNPEDPTLPNPAYDLKPLVPGEASGQLTGGNLSLIAAMCGTPYQLQAQGKIIFFEDVNEAPYRIDRMLTQMIHAGCFQGAKGILVGQFTGCDPKEPKPDEWLVADVLKDRLTPLGIPILTGAAIGHVKHKWTLPLGATLTFNTYTSKITLSK